MQEKGEREMTNNMLEEICTFVDECDVGSFGDYPICRGDYIDCIHYMEIIARKIEEYNIRLKGGKEKHGRKSN